MVVARAVRCHLVTLPPCHLVIGLPQRLQNPLRPAVVEEGHAKLDHRLAGVGYAQLAVVRKMADRGGLHVLGGAEREQGSEVGRWHREDHALLGLGEPDLPGLKAGVLAGHALKLHTGAALRAHLAHGRREATGAAVGDGRVEALVAGLEQHIEHLLLGDRVADLHGAAHVGGGVVGQLDRAEGGAVDAVAAGAPAKHHHGVAGAHVARVGAARGDADGAAVDERVGGVALIKEHGAVHGGYAKLVAVVAYAGHHTGRHAGRVQHTWAQRSERRAGRSKAEHVGVGDRLGAHAQHVADHAADAGVGAAEGLQGAGVIVRLHLDRDLVGLGEHDDAGVVHEGGAHPLTGRWTRDGGRFTGRWTRDGGR